MKQLFPTSLQFNITMSALKGESVVPDERISRDRLRPLSETPIAPRPRGDTRGRGRARAAGIPRSSGDQLNGSRSRALSWRGRTGQASRIAQAGHQKDESERAAAMPLILKNKTDRFAATLTSDPFRGRDFLPCGIILGPLH